MKRAVLLAALLLVCAACSSKTESGDVTVVTLDEPAKTPEKDDTVIPVAENTPAPTITPTPMPEEKRAVISFAGDCTIGDPPEAGPASFLNVVGSDFAYPFSQVRSIFSNDDLTIVNFEGALTSGGDRQAKEYNFKAPPEYVKVLTQGAVEAVNLANNHTSDYGEQGLADTKAALDGADITWCYNDQPGFTTAGDISVALLGYYSQYHEDYAAHVSAARDKGAELVIACCHWGEEGVYKPASRQVNMAHELIDAGADIVFGTHSHVLQPIEEYKGRYIMYSLGNFAFGGNKDPDDKRTAIIQWLPVIWKGRMSENSLHVIPASCSGSQNKNDYRPVVVTDEKLTGQIYELLNYSKE